MPSPLSLEVVRTTEALEALAPEWWALWKRDHTATPFQSPAWLLPWWQHVGEGELLTVAVRAADGTLSGLLPAYVYTEPHTRRRKLLLVGVGTSDYLGGVFDPASASATVAAALACLSGLREQWDEAHLIQLPPQSPLLSTVQAAGWPVFLSEPCSKVLLPRDGAFHGKLRENLRYYRNRAEQSYELRFETATPETALGFFDTLVALHTSRWKSRGEAGVLVDPQVQSAHRASIPLLLEAGLLRSHALLLDDERIAVLYGLADPPDRLQRSVYYYLNGFNPDFGPFSPGTLLLGFAAEQAAAKGAVWLDMLRGDEPYKRLWKPEMQPTYGFALPGTDDALPLAPELAIAGSEPHA